MAVASSRVMGKATINMNPLGKRNLKRLAIWRDYKSAAAVKTVAQEPNWGEPHTPPAERSPLMELLAVSVMVTNKDKEIAAKSCAAWLGVDESVENVAMKSLNYTTEPTNTISQFNK
jgi:hypothetical protein